MLDVKLKRRLKRLIDDHFEDDPTCVLCGGKLTEEEAEMIDYAKSKRGTESWWHMKCLKQYGYEGRKRK